MAQLTRTPGVWEAGKAQIDNPQDDLWVVCTPEEIVVLDVSEADAYLLAASPEMLEALESALVDPSKPLRRWQVKMIDEAIAKARGEIHG